MKEVIQGDVGRELPMEDQINAILPRVPEFVGWYKAGSATPTHTPPADAPCPVCWRPVGPKETAKWTSLMYPDARLCMFYALHPECVSIDRTAIDSAVLDWSERQ